MANFKTHLTVAAGASGMLATLCLGAQLVNPHQVLALSAAGTLGGILPDIDSDHSTPVKFIFTALAGILAFLVLFSHADRYSLVELWLLWIAVYAAVRYPLLQLFAEWTIHRGVFHSIVAALLFWFFTTSLSYYVFDAERGFAWLAGFFVFFGFAVHLALDEIYSVDLLGRRLKQSFGTALKLLNFQDLRSSVALSLVAVVLFTMTPSADRFLQALGSAATYSSILHRLLPQGGWFAL